MSARIPTRKVGRKKVYRAQLELMPNGRLWCVACCASSPAPDAAQSFEDWNCERGHGYWYESEGETVEGAKAQRQRLERLRKAVKA